jgi:ATP-binding cassette subfamily F protein uup
MALVSLQDIELSFGGPAVFDRLNLQIESGERIALLGRNGAGKTTLMKVISGLQQVDEGSVIRQKQIQIAYLPQEVPADMDGSVFNVVLSGLGTRADLLNRHHELTHRLQTEQSPALMRQLDALQAELDHTGGWDVNNRVDEVIGRMKLEPDRAFSQLSGGQKRRALLARALVLKPELLLLDEPTNHLDIDSMQWLEDFLLSYPGTVFFVTHDRMFMSRLATRIIVLDRGRIFSWSCDYMTFLERKQAALDVEEARQGHFDKKLAEEEVWIRQGVKARRCRNEGRVKALEHLREEKRAQRKAVGQVRMHVQDADPSGHRVIKVSHLGFGYDARLMIRDLTTQVMRGDRIGVIGPNGSGKTTLLRHAAGLLTVHAHCWQSAVPRQFGQVDHHLAARSGRVSGSPGRCGDDETVGPTPACGSTVEQFLIHRAAHHRPVPARCQVPHDPHCRVPIHPAPELKHVLAPRCHAAPGLGWFRWHDSRPLCGADLRPWSATPCRHDAHPNTIAARSTNVG